MTARQTNNSLAAALSSIEVSAAPVASAASSGTSSVASSQPGESVDVSPPLVNPVVLANPLSTASSASLSPELVSIINQAVQAAVQASQRQPEPAIAAPASCSGVTSPPSSLGSLASSFLAAGTGFQPSSSSSSTPGRPIPFVVPTFVSTFNAPVPAIVSSSGQALSGVSPQLFPSTRTVNSLADQPFVVGPGYSPVPAKLVSQIRTGTFVDLSELLAANLVSSDTEPQLMFDGRLVLSAPPKKPRRRIEDIISWTEAFTVFSLVLTSFFPHRWKDLTLYKLLILRIARQFSGRVWLAYDKAFRDHAAATQLADWSTMNAQLFTFHAGGASSRSSNLGTPPDSSEPVGSSSSRIPCMSWNKGRCTAPYTICRYFHRCSTCGGSHRSVSCSARPDRKQESFTRRRSRSPAASSSSGQKSRRQ